NRIMNREEANANFLAFIHNFITDGRLDDIVKTCNDNLLYLRGYAVSFDDNTCDWRFYFYPLKY
ncbi:MAG: hypothetical protein IIZ59_02120, partial [Clostridia bacterium]|nr:hypothetical protein [Clostridia bacterium]